jgi:hypothetical protein
MLTEHPIIFIEKLLKLGLGDKGRLLYLRNHIKSGKTIYESDQNFLKTMQMKLDEFENVKQEKFLDNFNSNNRFNSSIDLSEHEYEIAKSEDNFSVDKNYSSNEFDSGILKIQNSISELQESNSRIKDNLELILISRENLSQPKIEKLTPIISSSNMVKNNVYNSISKLKHSSDSSNLKIFGIKKHDIMAYTSAGLFILWYAGFQNIIDIGPFQSISLGLSAGAALSAGIFYKKQKISKS